MVIEARWARMGVGGPPNLERFETHFRLRSAGQAGWPQGHTMRRHREL